MYYMYVTSGPSLLIVYRLYDKARLQQESFNSLLADDSNEESSGLLSAIWKHNNTIEIVWH